MGTRSEPKRRTTEVDGRVHEGRMRLRKDGALERPGDRDDVRRIRSGTVVLRKDRGRRVS